jgi:hypothetical protein
MEKERKAYEEILKVLHKYEDICVFDIESLEAKSKLHLFGLELREIHGLDVDPRDIYSMDWAKFGDHRCIGRWGKKYGRTISFSSDGRQPEDETLLCISFPTGPYIFGNDYPNDYPIDLFQKFFLELKSFNPDYMDDANKSLYWKLENSKDVFNSFNSILDRYYAINKEDSLKRKIERMRKELEKLESNN